MFKPLKSLFKYIQNLHTKPLNDDKLIHNTKEVTGATTIATNTLSSTSSLTSSVVMQSGEFCNMKNWNTNSATQNNGGEQLSYHLQTQHMDDGTYGADTPYTDYDEDDIETQIKSSIMLKKPLTNNLIKKETIETSSLSSSSSTSSLDIGININSSEKCNSYEIVSPHYNCNDIEDDELEDFRYDPTENFQNNSPKHQKTTTRVIKLPAKLNDMNRLTDVEEEKENEEDLEHKQFIYSNSNETDTDMDEQVVEVEDEKNAEEPFINLQSITGSEIIVDTELSSSAKDNNHKDIILCNGDINIIISNSDDNEVDPLEIAQEDHEAFSVDRASVLKQLNLLNPLGLSQDDDDDAITVTTDGEMECWLDNDENDNDKRPPQIINDNIDDANDETNKPSSSTASCVDERGDGSDSGLGSETSALQMTVESMHEASQLSSSLNTSLTSTATTTTAAKRDCNANNASSARSISTRHAVYSDDGRVKGEDEKLSPSLPSILSTSSLTIPVPAKESTPTIPTAKRSNLKRRLKVDTDHSNNNLDSTNVSVANAVMKTQKKPKRSISFNSVHIYYFSRQQGFNCVPSAGGCTLGMAAVHESSRIMTLAEHTAELRRAHRLQLQEINPRGSSSDDSEESEEDFLSEGSGSDLDGESSGFLQPVSPKQRRAILKAAGIRKIDPAERAECRDIRNSREICGCSCRNYCDPETCSCSQWGIKCQVDRDMFPCGCTRESCGNPIGRVEFNSDRVHSHYIHTLLRLEVENRQGNPYHVHLAPNVLNSTTSTTSPSTAALASAAATASLTMPSCSFYQNHIPTQSNYSSGYGSPAYNIGSESIVQSALSNLSSDYYNHHTVQQQASTSSVHIYEPHLNTTHTPIINQFDVDDLDADLYSTTTATAVASTFSYAAAAARVNSAAAGGIVTPYHNINYDQIPSRQISSATFNAYHNTNTMTNNSYLNTTDDVSIMVGVTSCPHRTYSSCAVPSDPPFGTATTTESSVIEFPATNQLVSVLETTTAPSCHVALTASDIANAMETEETNNFINVLQAVNESNVRHNKISNNNNNNINNNNNANNNNNDNQINDLLHVTVAVVRPTTTTATINGHITMATVSSVSASTTEIQQQKPPIPMEMDVETATPTTTTVNLKMNDLRHCDAQSQNIINNTAHNNLLDHTGDSVAGTSAPAVNAAASISTTVDGDVLNVITPTPAKAVANPITTSLKTIINNAMINS